MFMLIFTFLFINIFLFQFILTEVVIPFKQIFKNRKEYTYNSSSFLDDNLLFIPYTLLNIGYPSQKVYAIITQNITDITFHKNNEFIFDNEFIYSPFNSDNYEITKETGVKKLIKDDFELYEDINLNKKIKTKIMFNFIKDNSNSNNDYKNYLFEIGFPLNKNLDKLNTYSLINQLKSSNIISNYKISLCFNSSNSGFYLIGNYLHYFIPSNFSLSQLTSTYSIPNNPLYQFQILFDEIYIKSNNTKINFDSNKIFFNLDLGLIKGTKEYFDEIDTIFFDEYYKNKMCKKERVYKNIYDSAFDMNRLKNYDVISCIKNKNTVNEGIFFNIKLFPSLYFYHREMNFSFNFDYNDLFYEYNGIYYFKIISSLNDNKHWQFGKTFFEKYSTTFDIESRKIYFYNKNILINNNISKGSNEKSSLLIILCIFLSIIFIGISFYIGKKIYQQRKLRKNELDDNNYDYNGSLSEEKYKNNKLIEMNLQKM